MRGTRKLLAILVGCSALLSIGITSIPAGRANTAPANPLQARRALLIQQLAALGQSKNGAASALLGAENAFNAKQAQLLAEQDHLASLNVRLLTLSGQIADDEATITEAKQQLGALTRQSYKTTTTESWVAAVLDAKSFNQAMDRLAGTSHVAEQVRNLQASVRSREQAVAAEKTEVLRDAAATTALEGQLSLDSNALLVLVASRELALQASAGPARSIATEIAQLDQEIAAAATVRPRPAGPSKTPPRSVANTGSCGNRFAYGQCTWYVASRRCIPWVGNADMWFANAARMGYAEGHAPAVGAVVTFWPGGDGASSVGHVGYVEVVGPAAGVPAGSFKLSEMNFNGGWNRVSYRVLPSNSSGIQGFIYAK